MYSYKTYLKFAKYKYSDDAMIRETTVDISGKWYSNWGDINFYQEGNKVTGNYSWKNGKIEGILDGYTFKGIWSQGPTYDYPTSKGDLMFEFSPTLMSFIGGWGFNKADSEGGAGGSWIGTRSNYPTQDGVDGSWKLTDARLLLEQGNNKVSGVYIKDKSMDYITIIGDIKSKGNNIYVVEGTWSRPPKNSCPNDSGKFDMKVNMNDYTILFRYANCDEDLSSKSYQSGDRIYGPNPLDVSGLWESNEGKMLMELDGGILTISYQRGKAMMEGRLIGNIFLGDWYTVETYKCPYSKGIALIEFNTKATSFVGHYTYCDRIYDENKKLSGIINR